MATEDVDDAIVKTEDVDDAIVKTEDVDDAIVKTEGMDDAIVKTEDNRNETTAAVVSVDATVCQPTVGTTGEMNSNADNEPQSTACT